MPDPRHPLLIHLHIPKNAGTTLSRAIKLSILGRSPARWLAQHRVLGLYRVHPWEKRVRAINASPAAQRDARFFEAHCAFGVHELLPGPHRYFTVLREPVDRALSIYHYALQQRHIEPRVTLDAFVHSPTPFGRVWHIDNAQVRYLAGERGVIDDRPADRCDSAMLALALDRLRTRIDHLIVQERFDEGLMVLAHELGWPPIYSRRSNVTRGRPAAAEPAVLDHLRRINELDAELHRAAAGLFAERAERMAGALATPLPDLLTAYRAANHRYASRAGPVYAAIDRARRARSPRHA
jgi:hypothetical protein